ncbi:MAG: hypothetical protein IJK31_07240 [Ruminococcus sp.]|nr:hypothetical protein [Ruminococcus sp.]
MTVERTAAMLETNPEKLIGLYHNGFIICIAFAILFFIISVILFFVFHIKDIFDIKTGRAQKRKIDEMEKENALTGRLITPKNRRPGETSGFSGKLNKIKSDLSSKKNSAGQNKLSLPKSYKKQEYPEQAYKPEPLVAPPVQKEQPAAKADADGAEGTSVLGAPDTDYSGAEGTSVLGALDTDYSGAEGTSVLGAPDTDYSGAEGTSVLGAPDTDYSGAEGTSVLGTPDTDYSGAEGTSVLGTPDTDYSGAEGTSVLGTPGTDYSGAEGTSVLGTPAPSIPFNIGGNKTGDLSSPDIDFSEMPPSKFIIIKDIMLIHTQEQIS